jgi:ribosomal protein S18 acetylase RimI-like enzyme
MHIRRPTLHDLNECVKLDPAFITQRVWQMILNVESANIQVGFQLAPLPRPLTLPGVPISDALLQSWQRGDCMYASRQDATITGFIHLAPDPAKRMGRLEHHIVHRDLRRQGIGSALLETALQWSRDHHLRSLIVEVNTKNHPAIAFYTHHGFAFSGFHERFYSDQEIILHLARMVR